MIKDEAIETALRTWYPLDHSLHCSPHRPLGKLLGEWGELLDDYMKLLCKPGFEPNFVDELGDIWYYIRILCWQRDYYEPALFNLPDNYDPDKLIAFAINETSNAFLAHLSYDTYSVFCLDVSYTILLELLDRQHLTLDELTELNWQKLQPGSERGEQWMKAHDGT